MRQSFHHRLEQLYLTSFQVDLGFQLFFTQKFDFSEAFLNSAQIIVKNPFSGLFVLKTGCLRNAFRVIKRPSVFVRIREFHCKCRNINLYKAKRGENRQKIKRSLAIEKNDRPARTTANEYCALPVFIGKKSLYSCLPKTSRFTHFLRRHCILVVF